MYEAPLIRILALNKPETAYIFVGAIASALVGSSFPMFAVLFGEVYGVSILDIYFLENFLHERESWLT